MDSHYENKSNTMLCYAALDLPPHPPSYYAIVYLCRKDLIKGEKEVSYLFYSALIKVYALVHTTTNYYHIAAIKTLSNKKS